MEETKKNKETIRIKRRERSIEIRNYTQNKTEQIFNDHA